MEKIVNIFVNVLRINVIFFVDVFRKWEFFINIKFKVCVDLEC